MADLYPNYAALAAAKVEGVDYTRTAVRPVGATWAAIAIHGGLIEAGSGPVARAVAGERMAFYEFAGIQPANNFDELHITSANFDEPQCVALVAAAHRVVSFHGYSGTVGVAETLIGGLDAGLRDRIKSALEAAGFTVTVAASELAGTDPTNICNDGATRAGVQIEMSRALRESFFPGGDLSLTSLNGTARTAAFTAYVAAVQSAVILSLAYDDVLSRVRLSGAAPGIRDTFTRTAVDSWGVSDSGHTWLTVGASTAFQVNGGVGQLILGAVNTSRWALTGWALDSDRSATVATDVLATGGGHFGSLVARSTDDGATCYLARLEFSTTQTVILTLRKRVAGTETLLVQQTTGLTHAANTRFGLRLQVAGSRLRARAWLASGAQPDTWQLDLTDTSITAAGRVGHRSILSSANTNSLPVTASWDDVTSYGTAVVERSTDVVRWATVRGGLDLDGTAGVPVRADDYEFGDRLPNFYRVRVYEPDSGRTLHTETDQLTCALPDVWLKSIARPFLNRQVVVRSFSEVSRPARSGVFAVVGRTMPVAVTDVAGSRRWTLEMTTYTPADADDLDLLLSGGDILFAHVPAAGRCSAVPGGYVVVGDTSTVTPPTADLSMRVVEVPCTEVAAPGPDVVGATVTCQGVLNTYATCQQVLDAHPTVMDLLELIGDPVDVIVP